jgi:hypothetical protein
MGRTRLRAGQVSGNSTGFHKARIAFTNLGRYEMISDELCRASRFEFLFGVEGVKDANCETIPSFSRSQVTSKTCSPILLPRSGRLDYPASSYHKTPGMRDLRGRDIMCVLDASCNVCARVYTWGAAHHCQELSNFSGVSSWCRSRILPPCDNVGEWRQCSRRFE